MTYIPKPDKDDYCIPKALRPITLADFILKGLEKLVKWHTEDIGIGTNLENQHAFTKGRSCDTALSSVVDLI